MTRALLLVALLLSQGAAATPKATPKGESLADDRFTRELPIHVDGGSFRYEPSDDGSKKLVFSRGVNVRQGKATASADLVTARLDSETRQITGAIAEGNVQVKEANRVAVANRAEFVRASSTIVLTGSARLWDQGNLVEGKRIVFNLETGTVDCVECTLVLDPDEVTDTMKDIPQQPPGDAKKSDE